MKRIIIFFGLVIGLATGCKAQNQQVRFNSYTSDIIGTWVSKDNGNHKLEFTSNNIYNVYINGDLVGSHYYKVVLDCGGNSNGYSIYLRLKESTEDLNYSCSIINNIGPYDNGQIILSLTSDRGSLEVYFKE